MKGEVTLFLTIATLGVAVVLLAAIITPGVASVKPSPDRSIPSAGPKNLSTCRLLVVLAGSLLALLGAGSLFLARRRHLVRAADMLVLSFLVVFTSVFGIVFVDFSIAPFEDAAILMRYAQHFGQGLGIVWNAGDRPVDGATDFLYMVALGVCVRVGLSAELASRTIGSASHLLTVAVIYIALRTTWRAKIAPSLVSALCLAVGPGLYYVAAYFGTPFFALFTSVTWWVAAKLIMQDGDSRALSLLFATSAVISALIRPEATILAGLMLLSIVCLRGIRASLVPMRYFIGVFGLAGGLYFVWRWRYFGYPLPNPYYIKGGGRLYWSSLQASTFNTVKLCLPFLPALLLGLRSRGARRLAIGFLLTVVGFMGAFVLLSDEMNFGSRFQYALLPIVLISWFPLARSIRRDLDVQDWSEMGRRKRVMLALSLTILSVGSIGYEYGYASRITYFRDGRYDVARMLSAYGDRGYTMATSEAGLLPLYSRWRAVDTWGLNDQWIAHNDGVITEEYLNRSKPHLIVFHASFSPLVPPSTSDGSRWFKMTMTLMDYAEKNNYRLAAVFGDDPRDTHYYYVRADFDESSAITEGIRTVEYYWFGSGKVATNFALLHRSDNADGRSVLAETRRLPVGRVWLCSACVCAKRPGDKHGGVSTGSDSASAVWTSDQGPGGVLEPASLHPLGAHQRKGKAIHDGYSS